MTALCRVALTLAGLCLAIAACAPVNPDRAQPFTLAKRPDFPGYGTRIASQAIEWNASTLAADFGELVYKNESGYVHPRLLRWEKPVTIAINDPVVRSHRATLDDLVGRVKAVAPNLRVSITEAPVGDITIRTAPKSEMKKIAPEALCFFVPVKADWDGFVALRNDGGTSWSGLDELDAITIFIPANAPPHVYRACIIEEVTQALGPRNDIYGLEDSIFNDDNVHTWPTAFDLLMIAVLYDPNLKRGARRIEAERVAEAAFASGTYGPIGTKSRKRHPADDTYLAYHDELRAETKREKQYAVAMKLVALTRSFDRTDHRRASALRLAGQIKYGAGEYQAAVKHFREAAGAMRDALAEETPRFATLNTLLGRALLKVGAWREAQRAFASAAPVLAAHGQEIEVAYLLHYKSIAEFELRLDDEARETARQSLEWAAYCFGADNSILVEWRRSLAEFGPLS